jgi:hypothetical protein
MRHPKMMAEPRITESQDFISGAGARFRLSRDMRMVIIHETPGVTRMTCWSGSSHTGCISIRVAVTLSDMSDSLSVAAIS